MPRFPIDADLLEGLNADQQTAVLHALVAEDIAIIHGPPGTGKTTTLVALDASSRSTMVNACWPVHPATWRSTIYAMAL